MNGVLDDRQEIFLDFHVPDKGRIFKVKKWLIRNRYIDSKRDICLLDIGCGKGGLVDNLYEYKNIRKYAIDIHNRDNEDDAIFIKHNCNYGLPDFNGLMFDIIFAGEIIEHIFDDKKFLIDIYGILKPGGVFVLTTPNLFFLVNRIIFPLGKMPYFAYAPYHYHFYDIATISNIIRECNFDIKYITSSHILVSTRRNAVLGKLFEFLGNIFPNLGAHIILFTVKPY